MQALLENGVLLEQKDRRGRTAMDFAMASNQGVGFVV